METNQLQLTSTQTQFQQVKNLLQQYKRIIEQKFQSNQGQLLQQLQEKTIKLKQTIALYRKQTSSQNIQQLISKKRHDKQLQRLELQVQWRNLTEKYKKLQEEQKIINQENRQSFFDIQNLQKKIKELQQANQFLNIKVQKIKQEVNDQTFITKFDPSYTSPYKFNQLTDDSLVCSKTGKRHTNTSKFTLKIQNKKKYLTLDKQNNCSKKQTIFQNEKANFTPFLEKKIDFAQKREQEKESLQICNFYMFQQGQKDSKLKKLSFGKGEKYKQLLHYLEKPQVKDKIFDLLRRQYQK